ncbi:uncharacterized protein LOC128267053 [Anopheles cruzii]|uniref:uncharacterized protein LOC128267053 n=1 Tax=Anopheles cruzii TaxID=68878 RepID=UPI0022EC8304|nr:uncharacterized protein LOC128267053 [Anopheles cruzii]
MDFLKSVLPPLPKLPKMKKIRHWNRGSLLNLSPFPHLPSPFNFGLNVGGGGSGTAGHRPPSHATVTTRPAEVIPRQALRHTRHTSDISSISATVDSKAVPAGLELRDNYGLYALKCDRNAAKRGILLHLPRKITQAVAGYPPATIHQPTAGGEMVHEKFSPCKQRPATTEQQTATIQAPPRRRKRPPKATLLESYSPAEVSERDRGKWQKNSSELFRIVERESANAARLRSTGGLGLQLIRPPLPGVRGERRERREDGAPRSAEASRSLRSQLKARSMDNLAATHPKHPVRPPVRVGQIDNVFSDSDDEGRTIGLDDHRPGPVASASASQIGQRKTEASTSGPAEVAADLHVQLKKATFFSIDNNSDEIEVRFRNSSGGGGSSTDESSETETLGKDGTSQRLPLPARVAQLRRETTRPLPPQPTAVVPLAEVLKRSLDSGELKRRWLNNLLADGSLAPDTFESSVDIFHRPACDFHEFDTLFPNAFPTPSIGNASDEILDVDRSRSTASLQQLCFSSSSFSSHDAKPEMTNRGKHRSSPLTTSPSPWGAGCQQHVCGPSSGSFRSTVQIQDYSNKQLQRVRYLASPSPSRTSLMGPAPGGSHSSSTNSSTPGGNAGQQVRICDDDDDGSDSSCTIMRNQRARDDGAKEKYESCHEHRPQSISSEADVSWLSSRPIRSNHQRIPYNSNNALTLCTGGSTIATTTSTAEISCPATDFTSNTAIHLSTSVLSVSEVSGCNRQPQQNGTLLTISAPGRECLRGAHLPLMAEGAGPHSVISNYDEFYNEEGVVII